MTKYDYADLRREVEQWTLRERAALDRWEEARWRAHDEDNEGRYFDTIGDTAGQFHQSSEGRKEKLLGLIARAEQAERDGQVDRSDTCVAELYQWLNQPAMPASLAPGSTSDADTEYDPPPPPVPVLALLDPGSHDYDALHRAVQRWERAEERELERWEAAREAEYDRDPVSHHADTIGDGAGYQFHRIQTRVEGFRDRIRKAEELDRAGDAHRAGQLIDALRQDLGVTDDAAAQLDEFLFDKAQRRPSWRRRVVVVWVLLTVGAVAAAVFTIFG